ncbi:MAG: glycosyltransferase family 4 protein [Bacteroidales bacterium]|nr:glycosyltransferase family 4 protein [Bacteroidales bacterium]
MRIVVLTPIYATFTGKDGVTPVVHYFAREWVKMGHEVRVYHLIARYPRIFYLFARLFRERLSSHFGFPIPSKVPKCREYVSDDVRIQVLPVRKLKPHSRTSEKYVRRALERIRKDFAENGVPDVITGHWADPVIDLSIALKKEFGVPICQVYHSNHFNLSKRFGESAQSLLSAFDLIGFRSKAAMANYASRYGAPERSFLASSGVSSDFIREGAGTIRVFDPKIRTFVYIGSLIERKHPVSIIQALNAAYPAGNYRVTFIGDGAEMDRIAQDYLPSCRGEVIFTGRIPREKIMTYLRDADFFVMISEHEIFGLVYLEAMAFGLIPIGSRNEGIDGIIVDGENGFLCKAGDADELAGILRRLDKMPQEELLRISAQARETAQDYSDASVAGKYADALQEIVENYRKT